MCSLNFHLYNMHYIIELCVFFIYSLQFASIVYLCIPGGTIEVQGFLTYITNRSINLK